jgi:hypothetical protein
MAQAQATILPAGWSTGTSKRTGEPFFLVPSRSKPGTAHYTNASGCTCTGFRHRGRCSHRDIAQRIDEAEARENGLASLAEVEVAFAGVAADAHARQEAAWRAAGRHVLERMGD